MKRHTLETFIKKSEELYPGKFDYSMVIYKNNRTKVKIKCKTCGKIFEIDPDKFWKYGGCCIRRVPYKKIPKRTTETFIEEAIKKYGKDKFIYDENTIYINSNKPVKIFCRDCNEYISVIPNHFLGRSTVGCPKCGQRKAGEKLRTPQDVWIKRAEAKWGDICDYSESIYKGSTHPVRIYCKEHKGYFEQRASTHLNGAYGCPICSFKHEASQSIGEKEIEKVLVGLGINPDKEYIINGIIEGRNSKKIRIDFRYFIGDIEHWIEFHGEQHYTEIRFFSHGDPDWFKKQQERDQNVRDYCNKNNIRLLEIPYTYIEHFKIYKLITEFNSGKIPVVEIPEQNKAR